MSGQKTDKIIKDEAHRIPPWVLYGFGRREEQHRTYTEAIYDPEMAVINLTARYRDNDETGVSMKQPTTLDDEIARRIQQVLIDGKNLADAIRAEEPNGDARLGSLCQGYIQTLVDMNSYIGQARPTMSNGPVEWAGRFSAVALMLYAYEKKGPLAGAACFASWALPMIAVKHLQRRKGWG